MNNETNTRPNLLRNELILRYAKRKLIFKGLLFLIGGAIALWIGLDNRSLLGIGFGTLCLLSFFVMLSKLTDNTAQITVNSKGISAKAWKWNTLPWEEVNAVWALQSRYASSLCLAVNNPAKYYARLSFIDRILHKIENSLGSGNVYLTIQNLDGEVGDLLAHIFLLKAAGAISSISLPGIESDSYSININKLK